MSEPPVLANQPGGSRLGGMAATFSLVCPVLVILTCFLSFEYLQAHAKTSLATIPVLALLALLLLFAGIGLGIAALALTKRNERKGVFGKALAGICLNGLLLVLAVIVPFILPLLILTKGHPMTAGGRLYDATNALATASEGEHRFYALNDAAKESFEVGNIEDARKYATELLKLAPIFRKDWNYGNAIQDGNLVLGRIAVREGRIEEAKGFLLAAGNSPGSPQMDSFGPNMSLAKDLLEKGEWDTVLQYFELCRKFWQMDYGKLDDWSREVKAGRIPDFGANLVY